MTSPDESDDGTGQYGRGTAHVCGDVRRDTWMEDVEYEHHSGDRLCAHRGQLSRVPWPAAEVTLLG